MENLNQSVEYLKQQGIGRPDVGVILGTGLHHFVEKISNPVVIAYRDIPNFPVATVEFHKGNLVYGNIGNKKVIALQGRFHFYEGYSLQQVVFPVRVMKLLGISHLIMTNAAGGIKAGFKKGDLVMISDHINLQNGNPLTGQNIDELGPRFPDMSEPYNPKLCNLIMEKAGALNTQLHTGVYAAVNGPNLETRAEYRYLRIIGADMVGMSTVPEVIAANHMRLPCAAISVITDECDPDNLQPVDIAEIIAVAGKADIKLSAVLEQTILSL